MVIIKKEETKMYKIIVFKNFGPFITEHETYEEAIKALKEKWFSPGVWDISLFEGEKELDIVELIHSWGERPIYC